MDKRLAFNFSKLFVNIPSGRIKQKVSLPVAAPRTRSERRKVIANAEKRSRHLAVLKPAIRLGASWIDDQVSGRVNINLCETCTRIYGYWWRKTHYRGDYFNFKLSDCDGCATTLVSCTPFYPEESFKARKLKLRS